jgi:hypothetical protein
MVEFQCKGRILIWDNWEMLADNTSMWQAWTRDCLLLSGRPCTMPTDFNKSWTCSLGTIEDGGLVENALQIIGATLMEISTAGCNGDLCRHKYYGLYNFCTLKLRNKVFRTYADLSRGVLSRKQPARINSATSHLLYLFHTHPTRFWACSSSSWAELLPVAAKDGGGTAWSTGGACPWRCCCW